MEPRIVYGRVAPGAMSAMQALEQYVEKSGLEPALLDLVRTRARRSTDVPTASTCTPQLRSATIDYVEHLLR